MARVFQEKMVYLDPLGYTLAYSHIKNGPVRETINQVRLSDLNNQSQCLATWGSTFRLKQDQTNDAQKNTRIFYCCLRKSSCGPEVSS
jgi:hypothetical protein